MKYLTKSGLIIYHKNMKDTIDKNGYGEIAGGKNLSRTNDSFNGNSEIIIDREIKLKSNKTYVLSFDEVSDSGISVWNFIDSNGNNATDPITVDFMESKRYSTKFELRNDVVRMTCYVNTQNAISNIQIEEGTNATSYVPYYPSNKVISDSIALQNNELMNIVELDEKEFND